MKLVIPRPVEARHSRGAQPCAHFHSLTCPNEPSAIPASARHSRPQPSFPRRRESKPQVCSRIHRPRKKDTSLTRMPAPNSLHPRNRPPAPLKLSAFQNNSPALSVSCALNSSAEKQRRPLLRKTVAVESTSVCGPYIPSAHSAFQKTPVSLCALCALCGKNPYARLISGETSRNTGANTSDTTAISFSRMFSEGPDVSLNGSPTTSPSTAALCASDPLPP